MKKKRLWKSLCIGSVLLAFAATSQAAELEWSGTSYFKWLDGSRHTQNGLYGLGGTYPGAPSGGDQGQGFELELNLKAIMSSQVEMGARIKSRFNSNYWSNGGGWIEEPSTDNENSLNSSQYMKLRGIYVLVTPGYNWIDSATIGSNDWGQFDEFTIGKMRYTDRDNTAGLLFQGSAMNKTLRWDAARVSIFNRAFGPGWNTGGDNNSIGDGFEAQDAAYALQFKYNPQPDLRLSAIGVYVRDEELDTTDSDLDNGQGMDVRAQNVVVGLKGKYGVDVMDVGAAVYYADYKLGEFYTVGEWSPLLNESVDDWAGTLDLDIRPMDDLSVAVQVFRIGAEYQSYMAQRREGDVLLTEGHDATWGARQPLNMQNEIGWGGWSGNCQQLPTLNIDNEFSDFDEPMAESVIGWQGVTVAPIYTVGELKFSGEVTYLDYDNNWQAFGMDDPNSTKYPVMEGSAGIGVMPTYRSVYAPFQDKTTIIAVLNMDYLIDMGKGIDFFGKFKYITEEDNRVEESRYLTSGTDPYYGGTPATITGVDASGAAATGNQFDPFDNLADDDRDLDYWMVRIGAGYQVFNDLYAKLYIEHYEADVYDGTTAFHPMSSSAGWWSAPYQTGEHTKNKLALHLDYFLSGLELGADIEYFWGEYEPEFYGDFVYTMQNNVRGVQTGDGVFVADLTREFEQYRAKVWMKIKF